MATLSVTIIAKDEADVIARVLDCAKKFADETIVADTGSKDRTADIARSRGAKVYDFKWADDFAAARNFAFSKATCDYVMWLDADDVVSGDNIDRIIALKPLLDTRDIWYFKYATAFDKDGRPTFEYWRERVFRRSLGEKWTDPVHEVFHAAGTRAFENVTVMHAKTRPSPPRRNLDIYLSLLASGATLSPRQKFYFANELYQNGLTTLAVPAYRDFLASDGMAENKVQAHINLARIFAVGKDPTASLKELTDALAVGEPSAELCVALGNAFLAVGDVDAATFWYKAALRPLPETTLAFVDVYCYNYYPLIQLGLCAYKKGDITGAIDFTTRALSYKKDDGIALGNLAFFKKLLQ